MREWSYYNSDDLVYFCGDIKGRRVLKELRWFVVRMNDAEGVETKLNVCLIDCLFASDSGNT